MDSALIDRIRWTLDAARRRADRIQAESESRARELASAADRLDRELARARLARVAALSRDLGSQQRSIEGATVRMAEAMAVTSQRLLEHARSADFSPPPWQHGLGRVVEVKLSETREVTIRLAGGRGPRHDDPQES